jgi:chromosome partitioning protein
MVTIALYNLKGGVGKTAATINLAFLSAQQGFKTLIWDLDPQGSSSFYLGAQASVKNESKKILSNEFELQHRMNTWMWFRQTYLPDMPMYCCTK